MGRKGKEMSPDLKKVAVDLFRNGEKISDIARVLQQPRSTISDIRIFREAGTVKNRSRSGRPPAMDDRDYWQLEKIVKTERRAPLVEITAKLNEYTLFHLEISVFYEHLYNKTFYVLYINILAPIHIFTAYINIKTLAPIHIFTAYINIKTLAAIHIFTAYINLI